MHTLMPVKWCQSLFISNVCFLFRSLFWSFLVTERWWVFCALGSSRILCSPKVLQRVYFPDVLRFCATKMVLWHHLLKMLEGNWRECLKGPPFTTVVWCSFFSLWASVGMYVLVSDKQKEFHVQTSLNCYEVQWRIIFKEKIIIQIDDVRVGSGVYVFNSFASKEALRCLALALKPMSIDQQTISTEDEVGLTFIGLVWKFLLFFLFCLFGTVTYA